MDIIPFMLAWSSMAAGVFFGVRLLLLDRASERFARGIYRDRTRRF